MKRTTHAVSPLARPIRLDRYLVEHDLVSTRSQAKNRIEAGAVWVDGQVRKAGHLLHGGEQIEVGPAPEAVSPPEPEDLPLSLLYRDEDLVALDKPAGLVVHPAPGAWRGTLVNALLHHGLVRAGEGERPGIVHRLDRETSGVLLVARHTVAHEVLARQFQDRSIEKRYVAFVLGTPRGTEGTLEWAIGRHPRERQRMSIRSPRGRIARTRWRLRESFGAVSVLEVRPETGRTHQIRVHLAAMGHAVLADPMYGSRKGRALPPEGPGRELARQALHAASITFRHPRTNERLTIEAPLAPDLEALLARLRAAPR